MLLLHSIVEEEKEKYDIIDAAFKAVSFVGPGSMFGAMASGGVSYEAAVPGAGPGEKINMEFERHHASATQTGKMELSPPVKEAFDNFYKKPKDEKRVLRLTGPLPKEEDDEGTLGE
jgi:hypothetical protein